MCRFHTQPLLDLRENSEVRNAGLELLVSERHWPVRQGRRVKGERHEKAKNVVVLRYRTHSARELYD